jgi:hypothetical protein
MNSNMTWGPAPASFFYDGAAADDYDGETSDD